MIMATVFQSRPRDYFQNSDVHVWSVSTGVYLSDERTGKKLHAFKSWDDAVNWLWLDDAKDIARALNTHMKNEGL